MLRGQNLRFRSAKLIGVFCTVCLYSVDVFLRRMHLDQELRLARFLNIANSMREFGSKQFIAYFAPALIKNSKMGPTAAILPIYYTAI